MSGSEKKWVKSLAFYLFGWGFIFQLTKEPGGGSFTVVAARISLSEYTPDPKPMEVRALPKLRRVA